MPARKRKSTKRTRSTKKARTTRKTRASERGADKSAWSFKEDDLERFLRSAENTKKLDEYFGVQGREEILDLADKAAKRTVRGGPRVLVLPGLMGSKLGEERTLWFDDVVWLDPGEIIAGNLTQLALGSGGRKMKVLGTILLFYLKLKLRLRIAGYDASFFEYDWRLSVEDAGQKLARTLRASRTPVSLVAHSMGGLVCRAALADESLDETKVPRVVQLGTPNRGSFVPVQALRGVYSLVRKLGALDLSHSPEQLSERVFSTFPGLYELLPFRGAWSKLDLYDAKTWPKHGPGPRTSLLAKAPKVQDGLWQPDERVHIVAGVEQDTLTDMEIDNGDFRYVYSDAGDGTVPLAFAEIPGRTWYVREEHGALPNNKRVAEAAADLIESGHTQQLPRAWTRTTRATAHREVTDAEEREFVPFEKRTGSKIKAEEIRHLLDEVARADATNADEPTAPATPALAVSTGGLGHTFSGLRVGRRVQHRVDIQLLNASITAADTQAYALGLFRDIQPGGAAAAVDHSLRGAVREFTQRRMFAGNIGEIFALPAGRSVLVAEHVLFAGLGAYDTFDEDVQRLTAENVMRTLLLTKLEDVATVLFGSGSGMDAATSLRNMMEGFVRALLEEDSNHRFRSITFCEIDPTRYRSIKEELFRLSSTSLFDEVEVTITETPVEEVPTHPIEVARSVARSGVAPTYLIVRKEDPPRRSPTVRASVLTPTGKAAVPTFEHVVKTADLNRLLGRLEAAMDPKGLQTFGADLAKLVLPEAIRSALQANTTSPLVVIHDAPAARIPWETLNLDGIQPAAQSGISRQYMAENMSIAKWLERRRDDPRLNVLLIVNPTKDLPGAKKEGDTVEKLLRANPFCDLTVLHEEAAEKKTIERHFRSGEFDVVHYCGHAYFDPKEPQRSGIFCAEDEVLSGAELAGMHHLPALVFFNACESARVRTKRTAKEKKQKNQGISDRMERSAGLAEAFLRGGVANYLGTYWPVGDDAAKVFSEKFYEEILMGRSMGESLQTARAAVRALKSIDWADYIHYGSREFIIKRGSARENSTTGAGS